MASLIFYSLLSQKEASAAFEGITQWFKDNPSRKDCQTETFKVRRDHITEDILAASQKGVKLP